MRKTSRIELRVSTEKKELWEAAALAAGTNLSSYIENCVDADQGEPASAAYVKSKEREQNARIETSNVQKDAQSLNRNVPRKKFVVQTVVAPRLKGSEKSRTSMCEHRRPAGTFCARCD